MRVLAGTLKGKLLHYPKIGIKPTAGLIRGAIFNMIGDQIIQARVADFFAGAGSLGIEAISRGAKSVHFFESAKPIIRYLQINLKGLTNAKLVPGDIFKKIKNVNNLKFDIILADPPYQKNLVNLFIKQIVHNQILAAEGLIVLQHHKKEEIILPQNWLLTKQRKYGDTLISVLRRKDENSCLSG